MAKDNMIKSFKIFVVLILLAMSISSVVASTGQINLKCQQRPNFNLKEKEYCIGQIPLNYSNETFKCFSYVKLGNETKQTNPEYKERATSLISLFNNDVEQREYFESANFIVNVYYTQKNLLPDYNYTIGVTCNSEHYRLIGETSAIIDYENLDFMFARMQWGSRNAPYIIGGVLLLIVILGALGWLWKVSIR